MSPFGPVRLWRYRAARPIPRPLGLPGRPDTPPDSPQGPRSRPGPSLTTPLEGQGCLTERVEAAARPPL
jgi:hypothetical protein